MWCLGTLANSAQRGLRLLRIAQTRTRSSRAFCVAHLPPPYAWWGLTPKRAGRDEDSIGEGILWGEFARPLRVVAFNTEEGWSRDVSEDIAMKLIAAMRDGGRELRAGARGFGGRA